MGSVAKSYFEILGSYITGRSSMRTAAEKVRKQARSLPDSDKLQLVDVLLTELDKPDPDIDRVWAAESQRRWKAYKAGKMKAIPYREVMKRFKKR